MFSKITQIFFESHTTELNHTIKKIQSTKAATGTNTSTNFI